MSCFSSISYCYSTYCCSSIRHSCQIWIDNYVFRLHCKVTALLLFTSCSLGNSLLLLQCRHNNWNLNNGVA